MKKILTTMGLALFGLTSFSQKASLTGSIENPYQDYVYLRYFKQENRRWVPVILDSAKHENGKFKLECELDSLTSLQFFDGNEQTSVYLNKGEEVNLTFNTLLFDESLHYTGKASAPNNYMAQLTIAEEIQLLGFDISSIEPNVKDTANLFKYMDENFENLIKYVDQGLEKHPEMEFFLNDKKAYYNWMHDRYKNNVREQIQFAIMEKEVVGKPMAEIKGIDLKEKEIALSSFYGKPVVVDFWATWCGPCKYEIPFLQEIEEEYKGKVEVVSVCVWDQKEKWLEGAPQYGFKNNIFLEKEPTKMIADQYLIRGIPRYMVLDQKGNIVHINAERPSGSLRDQLDELLK